MQNNINANPQLRRAIRRAILDHGRVEGACTGMGAIANVMRIYGAKDRLIGEFQPSDADYDEAIMLWLHGPRDRTPDPTETVIEPKPRTKPRTPNAERRKAVAEAQRQLLTRNALAVAQHREPPRVNPERDAIAKNAIAAYDSQF